jgi:hypothetical protein
MHFNYKRGFGSLQAGYLWVGKILEKRVALDYH